MIQIENVLPKLQEIVWAHRDDLQTLWPTPNAEESLWFAFTELGEAKDAEIRQDARFARNRAKAMDAQEELADAAMMLVTALGKDYKSERTWFADGHKITFMEIVGDTTMGMLKFFNGDSDWAFHIEEAIIAISQYKGMDDLVGLVEGRLRRIKSKQVLRAFITPVSLSPVDRDSIWAAKRNAQVHSMLEQGESVQAIVDALAEPTVKFLGSTYGPKDETPAEHETRIKQIVAHLAQGGTIEEWNARQQEAKQYTPQHSPYDENGNYRGRWDESGEPFTD